VIWTKEAVQDLLSADKYALERAILAIYARQTRDEKSTEATWILNDAGFDAYDARLLSSFAKQILSNTDYPKGKRLSPKQFRIAKKRMMKYHRQLLEIAKFNGHEVKIKS